MPGFVKATVLFPRISALPEDTVANSFYFSNDASDILTSAGADELRDRLVSFYNDFTGPAIASISSYLSEALSRAASAARVDFYATDELDPPTLWGSPVQVRSWTLDAATPGDSLPAEVAACLSYNGDLTDVPETATNPSPPPAQIRPAARLRGRLFIGPLNSESSAEDGTTKESALASDFIAAMTGAATTLLAANTVDYIWVGCSKTGDFFYEVDSGYVDNAFDTQRRRGNDATARTSW